MADTLRVIVDEIRTSINQIFDDKLVSRAQVAYWVIIVANNLKRQHITKRSSGNFLCVYPDVPVEVATDNSIKNLVKGRKYIKLPAIIFDFDKDEGIDYVAFYNPDTNCKPEYVYKTLTRTTAKQSQWLYLSKNTKPTAENPYFWRAGDYVYLLGIENVPVKLMEVGVYQTIDPLDKIDIDAPFPFPQELLPILKREVTNLARYPFLFSPPDTKNDGADTVAANQQAPKVTSVNDNSLDQ